MNYETIKKNYDRGLWSAVMVKKAVEKGVITPAQYQTITGAVYTDYVPQVRATLLEKNIKTLVTVLLEE